MILRHISLHRTNGTAMHQCWLWPVLWHIACIRTPPCKFGGRFHCTPSCANHSLNSAFAFNIVTARILPFPANALLASQPVKACIPSNALHTSGPTDAATFEISIKRVRV